MEKKKLLRITTVPVSLKLLLSGQLHYFQSKQFDVLAVSADGPEVENNTIGGVAHKTVAMTRKITPVRDLVCLFQLVRIVRNFKPDIVHTHTPKAGLLGMMAAWLCGTPVRMHTVAGLPLMEKQGITKRILVWAERVTYWCATHVFPNSLGLSNYIRANLSSTPKLKIIGKGSSNGIDTVYYQRSESLVAAVAGIRQKHGVGPDDIVYCFVGRIVQDKGITELVQAFRACREQSGSKKLFLFVVGPLEQDLDPIDEDTLSFLTTDKSVVLPGYQKDVRPWIAAADVFVFPSYREGFPNVVMQACCLEVPCVVSDINGCNEIIEHNRTGIIVKPKDAGALSMAMLDLAADELKRKQFASAARAGVSMRYDQRYVWSEIHKEYERALAEKDLLNAQKFSLYRDGIKPFFDFLVALVALAVATPVIAACMIPVAIANKGKVWFTQSRPGKNGKLFRVIKFKTMHDARDASGNLLPDDQRLTGVGKFIRKTSLDELPQLINVLKGDMSFVGPRPLLEEYLPLYNQEQRLRHTVTPGITGWAQVNGRNAISWDQKFAYDVWYVRNQSFLLDMKILFMTVAKVFRAEGISSETSMTMERWRGNR